MSTAEPAVVTEVDAAEAAEIAAAASKAGSVEMIALGNIERSEVALRDVDRDDPDYQLLVQSIRRHGVLNSILVRELALPGGVIKYGLIDGLQRFTAATDAGQEVIPARIVSMDDGELLEAQVITNMCRVDTKPSDLSKHLMRILARNPILTIKELALKVSQSESWVNHRLSLNNLDPKILELVNEEKIQLVNAYSLSKLPVEEQRKFVDEAMTESSKTFVPRIKQRVKEIREAKKAGKDSTKAEFMPIMHLQKVGDIKAEYAALAEGEGESKLVPLAEQAGVKSLKDALTFALAWSLNFDDASKKAQAEKDVARKARAKETAERKKKKNQEAREKEAAEKASDFTTGF